MSHGTVAPPSKPPMKVESREPKSIRYTSAEWARIEAAARARGMEPSKFARICSIAGASVLPILEELEASTRVSA